MDPKYILALSVGLSLRTCIALHTKAVRTEKIFFPTTTKLFVFSWGLFSTLRRILAIVAFFTPSLGLFNILYHFHAEQLPFRLRIENAKNITPDDEIRLYGMTEPVKWSSLDRWNYTNPDQPTPPPYSNYTFLNLKATVWTFILLSGVHLIANLVLKILTSEEFRKSGNVFNKGRL